MARETAENIVDWAVSRRGRGSQVLALGACGSSESAAASDPEAMRSLFEPPVDEHLLRRIAELGDPEALEELYRRHGRAVYSLLLRIVGEAPQAEELLQETFWRLWRRAGAYDAPRGSAKSWLLTVARNLGVDFLRSRSERQRRREETVEPPPPAVARHTELHDRLDVARALDELPPSQRQALELAYYEGLSHAEIAARMEAPLGTVKSWVRQALLKLRTDLGGAA